MSALTNFHPGGFRHHVEAFDRTPRISGPRDDRGLVEGVWGSYGERSVRVLELRVSAELETKVMAVGYGERGAALPSEVRVLEFAVGELVARGISERITSGQACGHRPLLELDVLVEHADRILTRARRRPRSSAEHPE